MAVNEEVSIGLIDEIDDGSDDEGESQEENNKIVVVAVGLPKTGKSTLLKNLFEVDNHKSQTTTSSINSNEVPREDLTFMYFDSPALGCMDKRNLETLAKIKKLVKKYSNFILLYCLGVGPGSAITRDDKTIVSQLTDKFGSDVWKRCLLALTFSDSIRAESFPSGEDDEYKEYLVHRVKEFEEIVKSQKDSIEVELILNFNSNELVSDSIIATPVAISKDSGTEMNIWPGYPMEPSMSWTDCVHNEIAKKAYKYPGDKKPALCSKCCSIL